ncbi:MAG: epoxyqueuosine reductase [Clostridia bacterium]|nr:epoxyqueuosine reductase [Clostridia bacterium]
MEFQDKLKNFILDLGISDVGFTQINEFDNEKMNYAVSFVVRMSKEVFEEMDSAPTYTYFHHYRTVNAFIDQSVLKTGLFLQKNGYSYIPIGASQSINKDGWNYKARFSSRQIACMSNLGSIGKNNMFIHRTFGPAVRLGTLFTNCVFETDRDKDFEKKCDECNICVEKCPAGALKGVLWTPETTREDIIDAAKCSEFMKKEYKMIGRGAVCGLCIKNCPLL